jgi:hypothetical protein
MLPAGLLLYFDMPKLSGDVVTNLEAIEASSTSPDHKGATPALAAASASTSKGLAQRLRGRLEAADRASKNRVKRRLAALDENQAGAKKGTRKQRGEEAARLAANMAAAAAVCAYNIILLARNRLAFVCIAGCRIGASRYDKRKDGGGQRGELRRFLLSAAARSHASRLDLESADARRT